MLGPGCQGTEYHSVEIESTAFWCQEKTLGEFAGNGATQHGDSAEFSICGDLPLVIWYNLVYKPHIALCWVSLVPSHKSHDWVYKWVMYGIVLPHYCRCLGPFNLQRCQSDDSRVTWALSYHPFQDKTKELPAKRDLCWKGILWKFSNANVLQVRRKILCNLF